MIKAFTLIELMIVIAILSIICAIAIPNLMEAQKRHNTPQGTTLQYKDIVGKTFLWNGFKTTIVDYDKDWKYVIVISQEDKSPISVLADRKLIMKEYLEYLKTHQTVEKE